MLSSTYSYKSTSRLAKQPRKLGRFSCKLIKAREVCASLEPSNRRKFKLTSTGSKDKEAKATLIIRNFVKVKARTRSSQLVAIVALISLKLVTFFSSKQHARASSRQKESSYRVTNYSWMQRGKNLAFHISYRLLLAFGIWFFLPFIFPSNKKYKKKHQSSPRGRREKKN